MATFKPLQDELDEDEILRPGPGHHIFQDEPDEDERQLLRVPVEPACRERHEPSILGEEPDEADSSGGSNSAYDGDNECDPTGPEQQAMFDMSFKTLNSFLTTKLCKMPSEVAVVPEQKKKRKTFL